MGRGSWSKMAGIGSKKHLKIMDYYNKVSLCLLLMHWLGCAKEVITAQSIFDEQKHNYHKVGSGIGVELTLQEVQEILDSLVAFSHLIKNEDSTYAIKPMGTWERCLDSNRAEYSDFFYGKIPVGGDIQRRIVPYY